jgi:4'-phosphopantetheinyl transferase
MTTANPLWQNARDPIHLRPDEVHVWRVDLDADSAALRRSCDILSADEQARSEQFYSLQDRGRYIIARGSLRAILARYLGTPARDLRFLSNAHGKPALEPGSSPADLRFNVSHSHQLALLAFARCREVGIDVEYVLPYRADARMAARFFAPQEVAALRALPETARTEAFFRCWTRKEAYVKARGQGLSLPLNSFTVSLAPCPTTDLLTIGGDSRQAARWSLRALAPGEGYIAAVAAEGKDWSLILWQGT